jgi:uncharacterized protein (TIGR03382 family)
MRTDGRSSQRRIVSRSIGAAVAALAFVAITFAPSRADAYCRTHTGKLPPDFPAGQCFDTGYPLFWKNLCVGYSLSNHVSSQVSLEDATRIAARAFTRWSGTTCATDGTTESRVSIDARDLGPVDCNTNTYVTGKPNQHVIFFSDNAWPYGDATNTLGKTFVTFNSDTGEIYDADMAINTHEYHVTDVDPVPKDGYDLESIITHEAGHFLGLAHSDNHQAVMYPTYNAGATNMRNLTQDDITGICDVYHPDGERTVLDDMGDKITPGDACDPTPRGGFQSACPVASTSSCAMSARGPASSSGVGLAASVAFGVLGASLLVRRRRRRA